MEDFKLTGIIAATFTPMKENGDVDYDKVEPYCDFLSREGVKQVYVNGSTGEGPSLTIEERMRLAECWIKAGRKGERLTRIIIQVGGACLKDSIVMAEQAERLGADAVSTLPPLYFSVATAKDLVEHCQAIAAAAPNTPMYYYHIPFRTGVHINMEQFLIEGREAIPTLRGIKFTDKDLVQMCACLRTKDSKGRNFNVLYGSDEQSLGAMAIGADGAIGSTYNFQAGLMLRMVALLEKGDLKTARAEQYRCQDVVKLIFKFGERTNGIVPPQKAMLALAGMDIGYSRSPMRAFSTKDKEACFKALTDIGFLEWRK